MSDRRTEERREDDVTGRVSLEKLRVPVPMVFALLMMVGTAILTYGSTKEAIRTETNQVDRRVLALEEQKKQVDKQLEHLVYEMRQTNIKLDTLILQMTAAQSRRGTQEP